MMPWLTFDRLSGVGQADAGWRSKSSQLVVVLSTLDGRDDIETAGGVRHLLPTHNHSYSTMTSHVPTAEPEGYTVPRWGP